MRAALVLVLAAGCVRSAAVDCGDGTLCAADQACLHATPDVTLCVAPDLLGTCDTEGAACGDHGRCYAGACLPITCGDALVDPDAEQCDDGNTAPGDGCSADCTSTEVCGNGEVDPIHGEQCDDGNARGFDGCDATCAPEHIAFSPIIVDVPDANPQGLPVHVPMAYFPATRRVVAVPDNSLYTWGWNGAGWIRAPVDPAVAPPPRTQSSLVYDPDTKRVLLFGGVASGIYMWEWDGVRWRLLDVGAPNAGDQAAAYDAGAHLLLVFGGLTGDPANGSAVQYDATTTWDGAHWSGSAGHGPSSRVGAAMAYDAAHDRVVLFGGDHAGVAQADTWQWHAGAWTQLAPATSPPARLHAALFPDGDGLILYGGTAGGTALADAWRWDGQTWTSLGPQAPGPRAWPDVAVDTDRHRAVLYGPTGIDTWEWDGAAWTKTVRYLLPPANGGTGVWDALRMRAIAVTDKVVAEVRDGVWIPLGPPAAPARRSAAVFYDRANDRLVEFGGFADPGSYYGDTQVAPLAAGAVAWTSMSGPAPAAREGAAVAYDDAHGQAVLFGGTDANKIYDDTWLFDGAWHAVATTPAPLGRWGAATAYDPVRREVILFGGLGKMYSNETWRWDGSAWTLLAPPGPVPAARHSATLTWNPASQKLTLYGGVFEAQMFTDVWEWDGTRWTEQPATNPPLPRFGHLALPQTDQSGLLIYGGDRMNGDESDEFSLGWLPLRP